MAESCPKRGGSDGYPRSMRLHDESSGGLRDIDIRPRMGVYVCGITPYDAAHVGHAFTYVHFDVLVRYLRHLGSDVVHVQNVTDVDDDMLRTARERGVDYLELAEKEVKRFEEDMGALNVEPPTFTPRATEFVPEMIEDVRALLASGHGYETGGNVYFRVSSDPGYGALSGLDRDVMVELAGERGGHPEDPRKHDPLDFVLWQRSEPGEPWWESPWGRGRPGWHIECSTMARRLLGRPVDVHGGGTDLIFPHHESERAQAENVPGGKPFVRRWVHTGEVAQGGTKMSKSLGNLIFVRDLLGRFDGTLIRSFLLRRHYREDWEFREEDLERYARQGVTVQDDGPPNRSEFFRALNEGLDTPRALAILDRAASSSDPAARSLLAEGQAVLGLLRPEAARAAR
jgi:L-cysteine:1D-myo-inositol 2-amino-2-deoxy-alpha-D-glucopyranoside ligase